EGRGRSSTPLPPSTAIDLSHFAESPGCDPRIARQPRGSAASDTRHTCVRSLPTGGRPWSPSPSKGRRAYNHPRNPPIPSDLPPPTRCHGHAQKSRRNRWREIPRTTRRTSTRWGFRGDAFACWRCARARGASRIGHAGGSTRSRGPGSARRHPGRRAPPLSALPPSPTASRMPWSRHPYTDRTNPPVTEWLDEEITSHRILAQSTLLPHRIESRVDARILDLLGRNTQ